jgi:hypothetical protein
VNTVYKIVKFLSHLHISVITSLSSECVTQTAIENTLKYDTLPVPWCVTHPDDGDVIAETCRRDRNVTIVFNVCVPMLVL